MLMGFHRSNRIAEEIKRDIANLLRDELKDPRIGFVTLTSVEVSNDLRHAKVFVSTMEAAEEREKTLQALNKAQGFIRNELGKRLRLRYTPEIVFVFDESIEHGAKILKLLNQVQDNTPHSERNQEND